MSIEAMSWALTVPVGGNSKVVLLGLANHAHPNGTNAYPGLDTLATYGYCDRSTARRNTRRLEQEGWIKRDGVGPQGQTNWTLAMNDEGFQNATLPERDGVALAPSGGVAPVPPEPSSLNRPEEEDADASLKKDERRDPGEVEVAWRPPSGVTDVDAVLLHYAEVMKPRRKVFGEQERRVVRDALKVATVAECRDAITSCERSDFHMKRGRFRSHPPGPGRKYNRVSDILRGRQGKSTTREQIDMFLDRLANSGGSESVPSGENARVQTAKRSVLTAWEFSADERVVQQGEEAAVWLAQQGWIVHRDGPNGRPRFEQSA